MTARRGVWRQVASAGAAKIAVMGLSGVLGIVTTRLVVGHYGAEGYAQYGLLVGLAAFLPFADLGLAAVIINRVAASDSPGEDEALRDVVTTCMRLLAVSAVVIAVVAVAIGVAGWWPTLLGRGLLPGQGWAATVSMIVFAAGIPLALGQRLAVGLGRSHVQIASQAVVSPAMLAAVALLVWSGVHDPGWVPVASYVVQLLAPVLCLFLVAPLLRPGLGAALRNVPRIRAVPSVRVFDMAWPMVVQMVALPVALQTDRLLLSHLTRGDELAQYTLASQLFGIVVQATAAAGIALWPHYAARRAAGAPESPVRMTVVFLGVGLVLGAGLWVVSPWLVPFVSSGRLTLDAGLLAAFVCFSAVQAAKQPAGMYLTDKDGLRFQVPFVLALAPLNLGLSWVLVAPFGAAGPVWGSVISVLLCQFVPNLWKAAHDAGRHV